MGKGRIHEAVEIMTVAAKITVVAVCFLAGWFCGLIHGFFISTFKREEHDRRKKRIADRRLNADL